MRADKPLMPKINVRHAVNVRKGCARFSQRVERRIEMAKTLRASIEILKESAADGLDERFTAELRAGEAMPDHALALELVARSVMSALAVLVDAEKQYVKLGSSRLGERRECERIARRELNPRMVALRHTIDARYGRTEGGWIHSLEGKTLRKPRRVLRQARDLIDALGSERTRRPIARSKRDAWLRQVRPAYDRLAASMKALEKLERKEEHACGVRDLALEKFDQLHGEALAYAHSAYRLAGFSERLFSKLRTDVERRRLMREAAQERKARAQGRRRSAIEPIRSVVRMASRWLRRWPRRAA